MFLNIMKRRAFCVIIGLIVLGFCLFSPGNLTALEKKMAQATRTTDSIKIDGVLKETSWKNTPPIKGFSHYYQAENLFPEDTQARILFDKDFVYIGIEAQESCPDWQTADIKEAAGKFEYGLANVIELFLDTNLDRFTYDQFMLHVNGTAEIKSYPGDVMKIAGMSCKSAVCFEKDRFTMEIAVPLAILHLTPETKNTWGFNIGRARFVERLGEKGPNSVFSIWNNTGGGFHAPAQFGDLEIKNDFSDFYYQVKVNDGFKPGDKSIPVTVQNQTGKARSLNVVMQLERLDGKILRWEKPPLHLEIAEIGMVDFSHNVAPADLGGKLIIDIKEGGRLVYRGGNSSTRERPAGLLNGGAENASKTEEPRDTKGYLVFSGHYMERGDARTLPKPEEINKPLAVFASPGEYEPASFAIRAQEDLDDVTVTLAGDLAGPGGALISKEQVEIRCVELMKWWLNTSEYKNVECYLTRQKPRSIPADTTQRYWVTVHIPEQAKPGRYKTAISIVPTNAKPITLPLQVEVLPISLGLPEGMNYFMYYVSAYLPEKIRTQAYQKKIFEDMKRHGMTTVTLGLYPGKTTETGCCTPLSLAEGMGLKKDYFETLPTMKTLEETGLVKEGTPIIWMGADHYGEGGWKVMLEEGKKRHWPEMLFKILDEPYNEDQWKQIETIHKSLTEFRKKYPDLKVRTFTALSVKLNPKINQYYDVWNVGFDITEEELQTCLQAAGLDHEIWRYTGVAPVDAQTDRYYFGLWSWKSGMKGAALWAYFDPVRQTRLTGNSPWLDSVEELTECTTFYSYVYPSSEELVPTIGWEAIREGIDDYRYLKTLEKMIERAETEKLEPQLVVESRNLLDEIRGKIHVENMKESMEAAVAAAEKSGTFRTPAGSMLFDRQPPEPALMGPDYDRIRYRLAQQIIKMGEILK